MHLMIIGILSDTHGHLERTRQAATLLKDANIETLIHCGDVGAESVLIELITILHPLPIFAVGGNVDLHDDAVLHFPPTAGATVFPRLGELTLANKKIGILHGDDAHALDRATLTDLYDYVFTGHTHRASDERIGKTRVINPGALTRTISPSVATLDLSTDTLNILTID